MLLDSLMRFRRSEPVLPEGFLSDAIELEVELQRAAHLPVSEDGDDVERLFESCMPLLVWRARRLLPNREDSEDALQDALLRAYRNFGQFQGRSQFITWVQSIMVNSARSLLRKQRVRVQGHAISEDIHTIDRIGSPQLPPSDANPERDCLQSERARMVSKILERLPRRTQRILHLYEVEGRSTKDIGRMLGVTSGTVKSQLHRTRRMLAVSVQRRKGIPGTGAQGTPGRERSTTSHLTGSVSESRGTPPPPRERSSAHRAIGAA